MMRSWFARDRASARANGQRTPSLMSSWLHSKAFWSRESACRGSASPWHSARCCSMCAALLAAQPALSPSPCKVGDKAVVRN
jgi:hypothetical protein